MEERSLCSTWLLPTPTHSRTAAGMNGGAQFNRLDMPLDSFVTFYQSLHPTPRSEGFPFTHDVEEGEKIDGEEEEAAAAETATDSN